MQSPLTTILFDMDNTLFDLIGAQVAACNAVAEFFGRSDGEILFEEYFLSNHRGFESHENISDYMQDHGLPDNGNYDKARRIYEHVKLEQIFPYDGVEQTIRSLSETGYNMAIITDAHSYDATRRLEKTTLLPHFDGIIAFDMVMAKKPSPVPFLAALEMMKAVPGNTLLVGDSPRRDIYPARELGIRTVYARYGDRFSQVRDCPDADFIINRMDELLPIIRSITPE